ncbi:MAG: CPBP family glutamic-type intramembrane protease, partial [Sediminibacterium sp.]|nr:CPBP family glutamic-type intramembrane protease [Sediminibacterium sp.]
YTYLALYICMLIVMIPIVYIVSANKSFQKIYPYFQPPKGQLMPLFLYWQMVYFTTFLATEFFYRGFILHGLKYQFGIYAIFIMVIPYCCVHFHKPIAEAFASIIAGIILGILSLKSNSIIWGVLIHYSVAICMDLMALWREGYF